MVAVTPQNPYFGGLKQCGDGVGNDGGGGGAGAGGGNGGGGGGGGFDRAHLICNTCAAPPGSTTSCPEHGTQFLVRKVGNLVGFEPVFVVLLYL